MPWPSCCCARGITPSGLIGHSLGENTAAALAEVFTFEQGVGLVHLRGTLFDSVPGRAGC